MKNMYLQSQPEDRDPGKELSLINYIDEINLVIRPVLSVAANMDYQELCGKDAGDFRALMAATVDRLRDITDYFVEHNRALHQKKAA